MPRHNPRRWEHSFEDSAVLRDREKAARRHQQPASEDTGTECARGEWCTAKVTETGDDGSRVTRPRRSPRPFCDPDRADIAAKVADLPGMYGRLERELRVAAARAQGRHGKISAPPLPLRGDVDALMHRITADLTAWWNRVAAVAPYAPLRPLAPEHRYRDGLDRVWHVADRLSEETNLDVLLSRPAEPMERTIPIPPRYDTDIRAWGGDYLPSGQLQPPRPGIEPVPQYVLDRFPGAEVLGLGVDWVTIRARLDGVAAGLDLIDLHYRCRSILGQTRPRPEPLVGIRCYQCSQTPALVRADPPRYRGDIAYYSHCQLCGHKMTEPEYREHTERLAAMAGGRIVTPALD